MTFNPRNLEWLHLFNDDILSVPDRWEFPWFAAWDLAFYCIPLAIIDPDFAKRQLDRLTREWYVHPNGQIPAYEWHFSDVNPVLLWVFVAAALKGGRRDLAEKAIALAQPRLLHDHFPEYYDSRNGRLIGKEARRQQTWSVTAPLTAHELLANPQYLDWLCFEELETVQAVEL